VWTAPLEAAAIIALLLWRTGGVYGLPALGVVLVVLPLQYYFGYKIAQHKTANVEVSDARVLRMHEVLLAIKLVKFYVWEKSFARQVKEVRLIMCSSLKLSCKEYLANSTCHPVDSAGHSAQMFPASCQCAQFMPNPAYVLALAYRLAYAGYMPLA
jgi:hypothetical protein